MMGNINLDKTRVKKKTGFLGILIGLHPLAPGKFSFMLHVPLHVTRVIDVGGVSLWVSSVCWDTK